MSEVTVLRDAAEVAEAAAEAFVEATAGAAAARGRSLVALTGGSSAQPLFAALRSDRWRSRVPWDSMEFFFTDERAVAPTDPLSNFGLADRALLKPQGIPDARVHRLRGEAPDQAAEAARAAAELRASASRGPVGGSLLHRADAPPRLDLVLLGLGPDGHICSLFAGTDAAGERGDEQLIRAVPAPTQVEPRVPRLTFTPAVVLLARTVVLTTAGAGKAAVLARALKGAEDLKGCPAQWLRRAHGRVLVACDEAAAAQL
jgi:6-phosphogluconolactonase